MVRFVCGSATQRLRSSLAGTTTRSRASAWQARAGSLAVRIQATVYQSFMRTVLPVSLHRFIGSCDSTVRIFSIPGNESTSMVVHTHHVGAVLSLIYLGGPLDLVASGSWDCTVVVWSMKQERILHTFSGHQSSVICLAATVLYSRVLLLSGSADASVQVWDLGSGTNNGELTGHTGSVECIDVLGDCIVTGSADHR